MKKKFVYESLEELFESPDWLSADGRYDRNGYPGDIHKGIDNWQLDHESPDAHPFWLEDGKFQLGPAGTMHPMGVSRKGQGMFPGRLWFYHKIISFWEYPDKETFFDMVKKMGDELKYYYPEDEYRIINDPDWQVEIVPGDPEIIVDPETSVVVSGPWRHTSEFKTKLIPIQEYQFGGTRTEKEIGKEHEKSPLLKKKKVPQGWGSTHPKYQERRAWNMASLTSEGVADKYMAKHFGLVDPEEEFDRDYTTGKSGRGVGEVKGKAILKNPRSLEGFPEGARGAITENGDLYVVNDMATVIHEDLLQVLKQKGIIKGSPSGWEDIRETPDIDFITVQRIWGKSSFAIGESYVLPKARFLEERAKSLQFFVPFLKAAKRKNPQYEFIEEQVRIAARKTLTPEEYAKFKTLGS